jgi:hypothetical protein
MSAEDEVYDTTSAARPAPAPQARVSAFGAHALTLLGLALVAGGGLCLASKHVSWTLYRYAERVAAQGVSFDVVAAAGVVLFAAGMVARGVARVSRQVAATSDDQVDLALVVDQVLGEIADVRSGIDQLLTEPGEDESTVSESIRGQNEKDALYRMAASLDQLGGRLSQRIASDFGGLKGELGKLAAATERLVARVEKLEAAPAPPPAPKPVPAATPARAAAPAPVTPRVRQQPAPAPAAAPQVSQPVQGQDEDAVVVDLDAEDSGIELLERLEEEVEGRRSDEPRVDLYDPPPALPSDAPKQSAKPRSYENSIERLMPEDRVRGAIDDAR